MNSENAAEYTARLLRYLGSKEPLSVLTSTPKKIQKLIDSSKAPYLTVRPAPQQWSVAEIIAHLADTEIVMAWRYRSIAEQSGKNIRSFDQNVWEKNGRYRQIKISESLNQFSVIRRMNIVFLKNLPSVKWNHYGIHEERGKESIAQIIKLEAGHDLNHIRQIERIIDGKK